ncbi:hypothetical protein [Nocardioides lijunqiniae]|uniref:hypothetical protein n=1 Tax=Nocardioides lijunqiniae TaxID=2760832 RepID=UPI001877AEB9|nr:hypothetical protein [Nocardioides lijunqiniae]
MYVVVGVGLVAVVAAQYLDEWGDSSSYRRGASAWWALVGVAVLCIVTGLVDPLRRPLTGPTRPGRHARY